MTLADIDDEGCRRWWREWAGDSLQKRPLSACNKEYERDSIKEELCRNYLNIGYGAVQVCCS